MTNNQTSNEAVVIQRELNKIGGKVLPTPEAKVHAENRPGRRHRKAITTWQDEAVIWLLKEIASEKTVTQQKLIAEGLNMVLVKYGKPAIADDR